MTSETEKFSTPSSKLMHETFNHLSTIVSIAQFILINEELSPKLKEDMNRLIAAAHQVSHNLRQVAKILEEEE